MAQKVSVELVDDLDGTGADVTIEFGIDGQQFEIDLSSEHYDELDAALKKYIDNARKLKGGTVAKRRIGQPARRDREQVKHMRAWGKQHGYNVGDRGRIPVDLEAAYAQKFPLVTRTAAQA